MLDLNTTFGLDPRRDNTAVAVEVEGRQGRYCVVVDEVLGNQTRVKVVKNKVAPPFKQTEFDILYNEGISKHGELIDLGVEVGCIEKSGAWYSYGTDRIGQGRDNVREFLKENPEIADEIEAIIREKKSIKLSDPKESKPKPKPKPESEPSNEIVS